MEILLAIGAFVTLDLAAYFFGNDSRQMGTLNQVERALGALRPGDIFAYREAMTDPSGVPIA